MPISERIARAAGLAIVCISPAFGQVPPPPPQEPAPVVVTAPGQSPSEEGRLARSMADEVRRLADDIATDLANSREGRHAAEDARELAQAIDEFRQNRRAGADPIAVRRSYANLHASWEHLHAALGRPGIVTPVIERDLARIDGVDDALAKALGMNTLPQGYYSTTTTTVTQPAPGAAVPPGNLHMRRLAHTLVDRAEGLALAAQQDLGPDPSAVRVITDVRALAREADAWYDGLAINTTPPAAARAFGPVDVLAGRVERYVTSRGFPATTAAAWQQFASAEVLVKRELGLNTPPPAVTVAVPGVAVVPAPAPPPVTSDRLLVLADQLVQQSSDFVRVFGPTAGAVPQGGAMLSDGERLAAASVAFRDAARGGADVNSLALTYRDVDAIWDRLARRVNRIAKGRTGPNIQQVAKIGGTCAMIHDALGLPGTVPVVGPF